MIVAMLLLGGAGCASQRPFEFTVERPAHLLPGHPPPTYPAELRGTGQSGTVKLQFWVDTRGRVERETVEILESPHEAFSREALALLPQLRFLPAEVGGGEPGDCRKVEGYEAPVCSRPGRPGKKIRQQVVLPVVFTADDVPKAEQTPP